MVRRRAGRQSVRVGSQCVAYALGLCVAVCLNHGLAQMNPGAESRPLPVPLWSGAVPFAKGEAESDRPTLTYYLPAANLTQTGVVIAPGGGYEHLAMQKEGEDIALWLNRHGVAAFVLKYRLGPVYHHPVELGDAQRALRTVRSQSAKLGLLPNHIGMWGFSAGGHLTATAGTLFDQGPPASLDAIDKEPSRPDFLILAYPVITMEDDAAHQGSKLNLLGSKPDGHLVELLSTDKQVAAQTPPTFIFATTDDATVPVMNSVRFYAALIKAGVSAEMHIYAHGPHGVGLATGFPDLKEWPALLASWMRSRGLMAAGN